MTPAYEDVVQAARPPSANQQTKKTSTDREGAGLQTGHPSGEQQEKPSSSSRSTKVVLVAELTRDLTRAAIEGALDPLIGRANELKRFIQILCRRTKNNPMLISESTADNIAVVEGLAQRIADGDAPSLLEHKKIIALDPSLLIAASNDLGNFKSKLKAIIKEVTELQDVILFIEEMHTLLGQARRGAQPEPPVS